MCGCAGVYSGKEALLDSMQPKSQVVVSHDKRSFIYIEPSLLQLS